MAHFSSSVLREEGNALFASAASHPGLASVVKASRLKAAAHKYEESLATSQTDKERAKACKNLGATAKRMSECCPEQALVHACSAVRHYIAAVDHGGGCMPPHWVNACSERAKDVCRSVLEVEDAGGVRAMLRRADRLRASLEDVRNRLAGELLLTIAEKLFKAGVGLCCQGDHQLAGQVNSEAWRPLTEGRAAVEQAGCPTLPKLATELEDSLHLQRCTCESVQARQKGYALMRVAVEGCEQLDMEAVFAAIDFFKEAELLTREADIENEAIALSARGSVYDTVLRDQPRARTCYVRAMHLANSLLPRSFHGQDWFTACSAALQRYQQEAVSRDAAAAAEEREPYLQALAGELNALREVAVSASALLKHVYRDHPPANPAHRLEEEPNCDNTKRLLKAAITHFHPDTALRGGYARKEAVLREEIVKLLTAKYEFFK